MAVNDGISKSLISHGGNQINERVYNYLGSLGYTGTISDRLAQHTFEGKIGWQALIAEFGAGLSPTAQIRNLLFSGGQQGVLYYPKPMVDGDQVLWQDAAGTTPVTADGQVVGRMDDLSGNSNHITQSTAAAKPIYRTDGTLHWLEGDGVDDVLRTAVFSSVIAQPNTHFAAIRYNDDGLAFDSIGSTNRQFLSIDTSRRYNANAGATIQSAIQEGSFPFGPDVSTALFNGASSYVRRNGASIVTGDAGTNSTDGVTLLGNIAIARSQHDIYGYILIDNNPTDADRAEVEEYLANLSGVTL